MLFFLFKQKTAYEMRISDWSSDVCSSDLLVGGFRPRRAPLPPRGVAHDRGYSGRPHRSWRTQVDARRRHRLHRLGAAWPAGLYPGGMLVLPLPVRAAGNGGDAPLGAGQPGRRICVRFTAPLLDASHWPTGWKRLVEGKGVYV